MHASIARSPIEERRRTSRSTKRLLGVHGEVARRTTASNRACLAICIHLFRFSWLRLSRCKTRQKKNEKDRSKPLGDTKRPLSTSAEDNQEIVSSSSAGDGRVGFPPRGGGDDRFDLDSWTVIAARPAMHKALERTLLCAVAGNTAAIAYQAFLEPCLTKWWRRRIHKRRAKETQEETDRQEENTCPCRWCRKGTTNQKNEVVSIEMLEHHTNSVVASAIESNHVPVLYDSAGQDEMERIDDPEQWKMEVESLSKAVVQEHEECLEPPSTEQQVTNDVRVPSTHDRVDEEKAEQEGSERTGDSGTYCHNDLGEKENVNQEANQYSLAGKENLCDPPALEQENEANQPPLESATKSCRSLAEVTKDDVCLTLSSCLTLEEAFSSKNTRYSTAEDAEEEAEEQQEEPMQSGPDESKPRQSGDWLWSVYHSDSNFATKLPLTDFRFRRSTDALFMTEIGVQEEDQMIDHGHPTPSLKFHQAVARPLSESSPSPVPPATPPINWALRLAQSDMMHLYAKKLDLRGSPAQRIPCDLSPELCYAESEIRSSRNVFSLEDFPLVPVRRSA